MNEISAEQFANWDPSPDQIIAHDGALVWWKDLRRKPLLTIGGFAGTGKTSLVGRLAGELTSIDKPPRIAFATLTGKASKVLSRSLAKAGFPNASVSTIHRLIYEPIVNKMTGAVMGWRRKDVLDFDLIVVDEASMVSSTILQDLMSYGVPILAVGDHGQLPPVGEDAGVMKRPDFRLEKIHRQAEGNPIIELSARVRGSEKLSAILADLASDADDAIIQHYHGRGAMSLAIDFGGPPDGMLITFTNSMRIGMNNGARKSLGRRGTDPVVGDTVICVRNARLPSGDFIANGSRGVVTALTPRGDDVYDASVVMDAGELSIVMSAHQFGVPTTFKTFTEVPGRHFSWESVGVLMDYGYALTCHKSVLGDTLVCPVEGSPKRVVDFRGGEVVKGVDDNGQVVETEVVALHDHGILEAFEVEFDDGYKIGCSIEHKFLTDQGQKGIGEIVALGLEVLCAEGEKRWLEQPLRSDVTDQARSGGPSEKVFRMSSGVAHGEQSQQDCGSRCTVRTEAANQACAHAPSLLRGMFEASGPSPAQRWLADEVRHHGEQVHRPAGPPEGMSGMPCHYCAQQTGADEQVARMQSKPGGTESLIGGSEGSWEATRSEGEAKLKSAGMDRSESGYGFLAGPAQRSDSGSMEEVSSRAGEGQSGQRGCWPSGMGEDASRGVRGEDGQGSGSWAWRRCAEKVAGRESGEVRGHLEEDGCCGNKQVQAGGLAAREWDSDLVGSTNSLRGHPEAGRLRLGDSLGGDRRLLAFLYAQEHAVSPRAASLHTTAGPSAQERSAQSRNMPDSYGKRVLLDQHRSAAGPMAEMAYSHAPLSSTGGLVRRRVVRIRSMGLRRMYDLEVAHPKHNFLLSNGIVTSNSQGSQAPQVAVLMENALGRLTEDERRRWAYTAITRATDKVMIVTGV